MVLIKALADENISLASFGLSVDDVKELSLGFTQLLYTHTKGEGNVVAHSPARYAIDILDFLV